MRKVRIVRTIGPYGCRFKTQVKRWWGWKTIYVGNNDAAALSAYHWAQHYNYEQKEVIQTNSK